MSTVLFTVAAMSELESALKMIKSAQNCFAQQQSIIYLLDCTGDAPLIDGASVIKAQTLMEKSFLHEAFFFNMEELRMRVTVLAAQRLCADGNETIFSVPHITFADRCRPALPKNTIVGMCTESETSLPSVAACLSSIHQISTKVLMFGTGDGTQRYLDWCADKMSWIVSRARLEHMYDMCDAVNIAEKHRDFMHGFPQYATALGCAIMRKTAKEIGAHIEKCEKMPDYEFSHFDEGMPIFDLLRDYYGTNYRLQQLCKGNPFANSQLFTNVSALTGDTHVVPVPHIATAFYERRSDVARVFPQPFGRDREAFVDWFLKYGTNEAQISEKWTAQLAQKLSAYIAENTANDILYRSLAYRIKRRLGLIKATPKAKEKLPFGVNLCGFIKGDFGLGESARIMARILTAAEIPFGIVDFEGSVSHSYTNEEFDFKITNKFDYSINIFDINGDGLSLFMKTVAGEVRENRYNIGYWAWELPEFPPNWLDGFQYVDEVWTCSDFASDAIRQKAQVPVLTVPHAVAVDYDISATKAQFGLPDKFTFLMMYDVQSFSARKNPQAAVEAFLKAFGENEDVQLLIKLNVPDNWDGEDDLLDSLNQNKNIITYAKRMSKKDLDSLIGVCDAFVSLHRSEGFGLGWLRRWRSVSLPCSQIGAEIRSICATARAVLSNTK